MADTGDTVTNLDAHAQTFEGFKAVMVWGTVASALVVALVIFLIAN